MSKVLSEELKKCLKVGLTEKDLVLLKKWDAQYFHNQFIGKNGGYVKKYLENEGFKVWYNNDSKHWLVDYKDIFVGSYRKVYGMYNLSTYGFINGKDRIDSFYKHYLNEKRIQLRFTNYHYIYNTTLLSFPKDKKVGLLSVYDARTKQEIGCYSIIYYKRTKNAINRNIERKREKIEELKSMIDSYSQKIVELEKELNDCNNGDNWYNYCSIDTRFYESKIRDLFNLLKGEQSNGISE